MKRVLEPRGGPVTVFLAENGGRSIGRYSKRRSKMNKSMVILGAIGMSIYALALVSCSHSRVNIADMPIGYDTTFSEKTYSLNKVKERRDRENDRRLWTSEEYSLWKFPVRMKLEYKNGEFIVKVMKGMPCRIGTKPSKNPVVCEECGGYSCKAPSIPAEKMLIGLELRNHVFSSGGRGSIKPEIIPIAQQETSKEGIARVALEQIIRNSRNVHVRQRTGCSKYVRPREPCVSGVWQEMLRANQPVICARVIFKYIWADIEEDLKLYNVGQRFGWGGAAMSIESFHHTCIDLKSDDKFHAEWKRRGMLREMILQKEINSKYRKATPEEKKAGMMCVKLCGLKKCMAYPSRDMQTRCVESCYRECGFTLGGM